MKLLKYALNYLRNNPLKLIFNASIIFVMAFVIFTSINIRNSQNTLYQNMQMSTPVTYELRGDLEFINDPDVRVIVSIDDDHYNQSILATVEALNEIKEFSEVKDYTLTYYLNPLWKTDDGSYLSFRMEGLDTKQIDDYDRYMIEGENLDESDSTANNVIINEMYLYDQKTDSYYTPKVGDEISIPLTFFDASGNVFDLGEFKVIVKGIFDDNNYGYLSKMIMSDELAKTYLEEYLEAYTSYPTPELLQEIKGKSPDESFTVYDLLINYNNFGIYQASFELTNPYAAENFIKKAEDMFASKFALEGGVKYERLHFELSDESNDISNIIEPFKALRNNLDSSILAILVFCVIMLIISSIYMINSRQKEMMIRSALGEKRKRQFLQYLIENSVISFITTTIAYILNITIISKVIEAMFKRSIETQNDLKRIATGELGAFDELYELSRYNILNIQITDYFITLLIILILVTIASLLSFFTQKKNDYRTFLNG